MRRLIAVIGLALLLVGCGPSVPAPLKVDNETNPDDCCLLSFIVIDVIANPTLGPVNKNDGQPLMWPRGFTARWVESEIEVLDRSGRVVMRTGGRYWLSPLYPPYDRFVVGEVKPCGDCELGGGPL